MFAETATEHRALAQLYRWYQLYERPITPERIAHQLEILDQDVLLEMTYGTARGHDAYLAGVAALPGTDRNAHHVLHAEVTPLDDRTTMIQAEVVYQRLAENGTLTSNLLHYDLWLEHQPDALPIFTRIRVRAVGPDEATMFEDAYAESRAKSFLHHWLQLVENVDGSPAPLQELLATDGFSLYLTSASEPLTTFEQLETWFAGVGAQIDESSHRARNLKVSVMDEDTFSVSVDFDWLGVTGDGRLMAGETHHDWILEDTGERFLRLKQANVTTSRPFEEVPR